LQLQDSCRESRHEAQELRHENGRLRHECREREKFWRALWQARKTSHGPESDDLPPLPVSISSTHAQNGHIHQYGGASLTYRINDDPLLCNSSYNAGPSHYQNSHSPSVSYAGVDTDPSNDSSLNSVSHRGAKYSPYPYSVQGLPREGPWGQAMGLSTSSGGESGAAASSHSSHSPGHAETPGVTSPEMPYVARFPVEDQKISLSSLDTAPYVFPHSRSLSPTTSTPGSSSSTPITTSSTSFPFTFPDASAQERADFDYRRHVHPGTEVTLHGGTADISLPGSQSDALRYRLPTRSTTSSDRPLLSGLPHFSSNDIGSPHDRGSSDGDSTIYPHSRLRPRRGNINAPSRSSRSPSPSAPTLSGTLAVIKAQAFGALRRTRARTKKSSEGAAKVAMDVLEARGIGMGVSTGSKRPRLHDDELDMSDT
jgi:hypothetical protein